MVASTSILCFNILGLMQQNLSEICNKETCEGICSATKTSKNLQTLNEACIVIFYTYVSVSSQENLFWGFASE